jgi:hypothetical protein
MSKYARIFRGAKMDKESILGDPYLDDSSTAGEHDAAWIEQRDAFL